MIFNPTEVAGLVINYRTKDLIERSVSAFREHYPNVHLLVVDGSNFDESSKWLFDFATRDNHTTLFHFNYNIHHGPGMDLGISILNRKHIFVFDSDTFLAKGWLIESMLKSVSGADRWYGIGKIYQVDNTGFVNADGEPYLHPSCMLLNREEYLKRPRFVKHGAPCLDAMQHIHNNGETNMLVDFDTLPFIVKHNLPKTCKRHGYNL